MSAIKQVKWLFLGPPGVGKGTYASRMCEQLKIQHFASGTILRETTKKKTHLARAIKKTIEDGKFVTNETVTVLLMERMKDTDEYASSFREFQERREKEMTDKARMEELSEKELPTAMAMHGGFHYGKPSSLVTYPGGYVLDGFPRSLEQAKYVDELVGSQRGLLEVEKVVNLRQPFEVIIAKLSGRVSCPECDMVYNYAHIDEGGFKMDPLVPKVEGKCDRCGCTDQFISRADDKPEVITKRLKTYEEVTKPIEQYYAESGRLINFDVLGGAKEYLPKLMEVMEKEAQAYLDKKQQNG